MATLVEKAMSGDIQLHKQAEDRLGTIDNYISKGSYGKVYKGKYDDCVVAIKVVNLQSPFIDKSEMRREVAIMSLISHPNIVHYIAANIKDDLEFGYIVMEYCENGSLQSLWPNIDSINKDEKMLPSKAKIYDIKIWPLRARLELARGIAEGMKYLSSCRILHRDLKLGNVVLDKNNVPKITDFGTAKVGTEGLMNTAKLNSTILYMAPELLFDDLKGKVYSSEVDVFSYGVMLWQIVTREYPYKNILHRGPENLKKEVINNTRPKSSDTQICVVNDDIAFAQIKPQLEELLGKCWSCDSYKRPSFFIIAMVLNSLVRVLKN